MKENNLLASVALFGELYNNESYNSISDIIAEFIKGAVVYENKYSFNSTELTELLKKVYEFQIPESVVRTTLNNKLKDIVERKDGYYHFKEKVKTEFQSITTDFEKINSNHNRISDDLIEFVERKENKKLVDFEKKELFENFNQFLLDNGFSSKYSNHISGFIIKNQENVIFIDSLNAIKEGVILYQGIKYTADINELGSWETDLTIYLNTEHLFNALGYNGLLFQEIFNDFLKLVNEINMSNRNQNQKNFTPKRKIELKYFEETNNEINAFFSIAESIKKGHGHLDPSKSAMKMILDNSTSLSDIKALRIKFDLDLKNKGINLQSFDYEISNIPKFNVEDDKIIEELRKSSKEKGRKFNESDCRQYFKIFTKINYFRRGENRKPLEKIGHLFLTEDGFAKYLAHNNLVKFGEFDTSFAKDIDYIITRFWFKLKKGFSDRQSLPKSFDVVTKAKIILSSHINTTVSQGYYQLQNEVKEGKLTKEEAIERSYAFREKPNRPELLNAENVDKSLDFLNNESYFDDLYREKERKNILLVETQAKNEALENELKKIRDKEIDVENQKGIELSLFEFNKREDAYISTKLVVLINGNNKDSVYFLKIFALNMILIFSATILAVNKELKEWICEFGSIQIFILSVYVLILVVEIFGRSYLFNKEKLKSGWNWLIPYFFKEKKQEYEIKTKESLKLEFVKTEESNKEVKAIEITNIPLMTESKIETKA